MENKRKFKFGLIDGLIVVFIVLALVAGYFFLGGSSSSDANAPTVSFTVELKKQPEDYKELIKIGDDIKDSIKGGYFGKVTDFEVVKATESVEKTSDGTVTLVEYQDKYDVYITIEGTPTTFGDNIMFASQDVKVGKEIFIKNKNYVGHGYIVKVDINE